jgi:ABC-2 type transport system permease protein
MKVEIILLKFLDRIQGIYRVAGVNYEQLRAIVAVKLMMDNRRQVMAFKKKENQEPGNAFAITLLFYSIFGIFVAIFIYNISSVMVSMIFFFSYIMVMVAMTLITDFSSILLDTSDNTIILPRPVNGRTLFIARLTHVLLYLGQLALGLSLIPSIMVGYKFGILFLFFFLIVLVLTVFTALLITNATYLLIMQFASEEKLKSVINYFQIIMAVAMMGAYQLLPRMMGRFEVEDYVFQINGWSYLIPPVWMGGALELVHYHRFDIPHIILTCLCIVVPLGGLYITNRYLTPIFNKKLSALGSVTEQPAKVNEEKKQKSKLLENISFCVTSNSFERAAFELVYKILGRDRKIKLKIYPAVGYILVFGLVFMIRGEDDFSTLWNNLPNTEYYFVLIYLTFMISQVALFEIPYTDDFKASWFYSSAPVDRPGEILSGMVKAIFVKLFLPIYTAIAALILFVWGTRAIDDILFGLFNNFLILLIIATIGKRILPLTLEPSAKNQTGSFLRGILMVLCMVIPGGLHYLLSKWPLILISTIPFQLGAIYLILRSYKATKWSSIQF